MGIVHHRVRHRLFRRDFVVSLIVGLLSTAIGASAVPRASGIVTQDRSSTVGRGLGNDCPAHDDPDASEAEIGTPILVDGIEIYLEAIGDLSIGSHSLTTSITGKNGEPLTGAMVYLTIRMPAMDHGTSAYPTEEIETGRYRAEEISLGMSGAWVVTVEVVRQARAPITATYVVQIAG